LRSTEAAIEKSLYAFNRLFNLLLSNEGNVKNAMIAFDLTNYVSGRLRPEVIQVKEWLYTLTRVILKAGVPPERRDDVAAAILLLAGVSLQPNSYRWARDCLLRMNIDFSNDPPAIDSVSGFHASLPQGATPGELYSKLQQIRTYPEQVCAYLLALKNGSPSNEYSELAKEAFEEWPILENAFSSVISRQRILELDHWRVSCPRCHISLPTSEVHKLQTFCVATAKNCCRKVIVWRGN
jgi:hypothetical protein